MIADDTLFIGIWNLPIFCWTSMVTSGYLIWVWLVTSGEWRKWNQIIWDHSQLGGKYNWVSQFIKRIKDWSWKGWIWDLFSNFFIFGGFLIVWFPCFSSYLACIKSPLSISAARLVFVLWWEWNMMPHSSERWNNGVSESANTQNILSFIFLRLLKCFHLKNTFFVNLHYSYYSTMFQQVEWASIIVTNVEHFAGIKLG